MNYAPPQFRHGLGGFMPAHQSIGQPPVVQYTRNPMQAYPIQGNTQQFSLSEPSPEQFAFYSINRPIGDKWKNTSPLELRLSSIEIQQQLTKWRLNSNRSVVETLSALETDAPTARGIIHGLLQEQNDKLIRSGKEGEWVIAGLNIKKETVRHLVGEKKIITRVEVILKTESLPTDEAPRLNKNTCNNNHMMGLNHEHFDPFPMEKSLEGGGPVHAIQAQQSSPDMMNVDHQPSHQLHLHDTHFQGQRHEQVSMPIPMQAHMPFQGALVPQAQNPQIEHLPDVAQASRVQTPQHHEDPIHGAYSMSMPMNPTVHVPLGQFQQDQHQQHNALVEESRIVPHHGMEVLRMEQSKHRKHKSNPKPKGSRRRARYRSSDEDGSEASSSESGSDLSLRSVENGDYGFVERSRSRGRNRSKSKTRGRNRRRSRNRSRSSQDSELKLTETKVYKTKVSKTRQSPDRCRHEEDSFAETVKSSSKNSSPRSSAALLPPQHIFNIHIDKHNDYERDRKVRPKRDSQFDQGSRHTSTPPLHLEHYDTMYHIRDKLEVQTMSQRSSVVGGSDSVSSLYSDSSVQTSDDSVFSEPVKPRVPSLKQSEVGPQPRFRSRALPLPRDEATMPVYYEAHHGQRPKYHADDYPRRPRGSIYEKSPNTPSYERVMPVARRRTDISNPFDPRYPGPTPQTYNERSPSSYVYKPPMRPQRYMEEERPDPFELRPINAQLDAMNYMNTQRRSAPPRRGILKTRENVDTDEWAYRPRERIEGGFRYVGA